MKEWSPEERAKLQEAIDSDPIIQQLKAIDSDPIVQQQKAVDLWKEAIFGNDCFIIDGETIKFWREERGKRYGREQT